MKVLKNITTPSTAVCGWPRAWGCVSIGLAALLAGCGSIPDAKINYHHAKSSVSVKVVRTVLCDKYNIPVVFTTTTPAVSHSANRDTSEFVDLAWFRGPFSDADVKVETYDDGRLKSVNATSTGQGEAVLKAAVALAPLVRLAATDLGRTDAKPLTFPMECAFIRKQGKGDPITITYSGSITLKTLADTTKEEAQVIPVEKASTHYEKGVKGALGTICAVVVDKSAPKVTPITPDTSSPERHYLKAVQPGWVKFKVKVELPNEPGCKSEAFLAQPTVLVAQYGAKYDIPIPKPAFFGKQSVGLVFAESGALTSIQYASTSGATQALGGLASLLTIAQGDSTAQQVAAVKAEADLIAQQQRLVLCMASPENCSR